MDPLRIANVPYQSDEEESSESAENEPLCLDLTLAPPGVPEQAPQPMEEDLPVDGVYSCRYCKKTFTNKQALGGHQNAHKMQRTVQRNGQDFPESGHPPPPPTGYNPAQPNFLTLNDYLNRLALSGIYPSQQHAGVQMGRAAFDPARTTGWLGFGSLYTGQSRVSPYQGSYVPYQAPLNLNLGLSPPSYRAVYVNNQGYVIGAYGPHPRSRGSGRNTGPGNGGAEQVINWPPEIVDESGLDLTLKL